MANKTDNFYPPVTFVEVMKEEKKLGRPRTYEPEKLAEDFVRYVKWCKDNPIIEEKSSSSVGDMGASDTRYKQEHPRLVSIGGFLSFIGMPKSSWEMLDKREGRDDFVYLKGYIVNYCESYQLEMASAGQLKQNIISRLLGLTDKKEVSTTGEGVTIIVKDKEQKEKLENISNLGI